MADKSRFALDGLKRRRLDRPWVRRDGKLQPATWTEAFAAIAAKLTGLAGDRIGAIAGDLCDAESMLALKDLMAALGSINLDCRQDGAALDATRRDFYTFNTSIAGIEEADAILLIGTNPRKEAPVLNARIRKRWMTGGCTIGLLGEAADLTYDVSMVGAGPDALAGLGRAPDAAVGQGGASGGPAGQGGEPTTPEVQGGASGPPVRVGAEPYGSGSDFAKVLRDAKKPMLIVGQGALARPDGAAVLAAAWKLAADVGALSPEWHGFNVLHTAAARVGALDLGFVPGPRGKSLAQMLAGGVDLLWLLGADEFPTTRIGANTFVVYQGHHGDAGAARADVILPGAAYTEKYGTYVNTEGRVQRGFLAIYPPGEAREDWTILRAFSQTVGHKLPYDDLASLRRRLEQVNPVFGRVGFLPRFGCTDLTAPAGDPASVSATPFVAAVANYYQTDPISRASPTMAECTALFAPSRLAAE